MPPGEADVLSFDDRPGMPLGNGCWRSPNQSGQYTAAGFQVDFNAFVLQDWNTDDENILQTPHGGSTVVSWKNHAKAVFNEGQWLVNDAATLLQQPQAEAAPFAYAPYWDGWGEDPSYLRYRLAGDGCYVLAANPIPAQ